MLEPVITAYAFNLKYAKRLVDGVKDDQMAVQPVIDGNVVPNHAAWVIGHLAATCDFAGSLVGLQPSAPQGWNELFGKGSAPVADSSKYPNKATLIKALEDGHARVAAAVAKLDPAALAGENPVEPMRRSFPTLGDVLVFILTSHEATHLGQLSAWRRAIGLPSVF